MWEFPHEQQNGGVVQNDLCIGLPGGLMMENSNESNLRFEDYLDMWLVKIPTTYVQYLSLELSERWRFLFKLTLGNYCLPF